LGGPAPVAVTENGFRAGRDRAAIGWERAQSGRGSVAAMKKLLIIAVLVGLGIFAAQKLRS
jgi:hypothetical protein